MSIANKFSIVTDHFKESIITIDPKESLASKACLAALKLVQIIS